MMKKTYLWISIILVVGLIFFGCSSSDDNNVSSGSDSGTETSFNFTMTSYKSQETASSSAGAQADFTADQIMTGQLTATPSGGGTAQVFDWSIYFDETTFDVQSNKTIILAPGTYDFSLLLTKGDQEYAGTATSVAISDGTFDVPMTVSPVIGDTVTDVTLVASLADFKFQYDPAELSAASLSNPQMGIIVDGGAEEVFTINPTTGISDNYVNLPEGSHTVQLKLYEASLQVGRSITAQESVIITAGLNLTMDLVALHGETTFALTEAGGDANFYFNIPAEVVDEAGGLSNLQVLFAMVGPNNPLEEQTLTLVPDGSGGYEADITLTNKQFDEVDISLAFTDTSVPELLGSCTMEATLDTTQRTLNCDVTLRRRAIVGGSLLATLGINVMNEAGEPVAGATVSENGNVLGITGGGAFGTEGYLKVYLPADDYTIRAQTVDKAGESILTLDALSTNNTSISLTYMPGISGVWNFLDGGGDNGINRELSQGALAPQLIEFNSKLYAFWSETNPAGVAQIRFAEWDGVSSWSFQDGGGTNGINKNPGKDAGWPQLVVFNSKLYAIWRELNSSDIAQIRVAEWDGTSAWNFVDGGGDIGINKNPGKGAHVPELSVFNGKLYATWTEYSSADVFQVRVAEWDGSFTWAFIDGDGDNGINKNAAYQGVLPVFAVFKSKLYIAWREMNSASIQQVRVAEWDGGFTWIFKDGNGTNGINQNTAHYASHPQLTVFDNKLYATWYEINTLSNYQIRVAEWDESSLWIFKDGGGELGINWDSTESAYDSQLTVFNGRFYAAWSESNSSGVDQIRIAEWDGNSSWISKDGDGPNGINQNAAHRANSPELAVYNSTLNAIWLEYNSSSIYQVRAAEAELE